MKYVLKVGSHGRFENGVHRVYRKGDEIDLTAEQAASLGARVEPLGAVETTKAKFVTVVPEKRDESGDDELAAMHWSAVVKGIGEMDDPAAVSALLEAEKAGKARQSVINAAEARLAELGA